MIIFASTLAAAINECRHITPEELTRDTFRAIPAADPEPETEPATEGGQETRNA